MRSLTWNFETPLYCTYTLYCLCTLWATFFIPRYIKSYLTLSNYPFLLPFNSNHKPCPCHWLWKVQWSLLKASGYRLPNLLNTLLVSLIAHCMYIPYLSNSCFPGDIQFAPPVMLYTDIAQQHHRTIMGREGGNLQRIMYETCTSWAPPPHPLFHSSMFSHC